MDMIIFDMDGTIWNTVSATYTAACKVMDTHGYERISKKVIEDNMGESYENVKIGYMPSFDNNTRETIMQEIVIEIRNELKKGNVLIYDGVSKVVKELSKDYKLGIITNNDTTYVEYFFDKSNLKSYFNDYLGCAGLFNTKSEAMKYMKEKNDAKNIIYVGDTDIDKKEALDADATFVHARYGFRYVDNNYYINDIKELPKLIEKIKCN